MVVECANCHNKYNVDASKIPAAGVKVRCHKCQNIILINKTETAPPVPKPAPVIMPRPEPAIPPKPEPTVSPKPAPVIMPKPEPAIPPEPEPTVSPRPAPVIMPKPQLTVPSEPDLTIPPPEVKKPSPENIQPKIEITTSMYDMTPPKPQVTPAPPIMTPPIETQETATPEPVVIKRAATEPPMSEEDKKWHDRAKRLAKALASDLVLYNQEKVEQGLKDGTIVQLLGSEIRRSWEYYCQQIPKHIVDATDYFKEQLNKVVGKGKEIFK